MTHFSSQFLNHIDLMKTYLTKNNKSQFTRKEFLRTARTTSYYFEQMQYFGLLRKVGCIKDHAGQPYIYELNKAFTSHINPAPDYMLSEEDINLLIDSKSKSLRNLNDSIQVMQKQVKTLSIEQKALMALKS
jgi:hypothetical protein